MWVPRTEAELDMTQYEEWLGTDDVTMYEMMTELASALGIDYSVLQSKADAEQIGWAENMANGNILAALFEPDGVTLAGYMEWVCQAAPVNGNGNGKSMIPWYVVGGALGGGIGYLLGRQMAGGYQLAGAGVGAAAAVLGVYFMKGRESSMAGYVPRRVRFRPRGPMGRIPRSVTYPPRGNVGYIPPKVTYGPRGPVGNMQCGGCGPKVY
jgi:hypothetical protein